MWSDKFIQLKKRATGGTEGRIHGVGTEYAMEQVDEGALVLNVNAKPRIWMR